MTKNRMEQKTHTMIQVETCPETPDEIKKASEALACGNDVFQHNQYMCLPNVEKTSFVEFCYDGIMGIQVEGKCLEVNTEDGKVIAQSCKDFSSGCPQDPFWNFDFYKYPACLDINPREKCYTFHPSCSHEGKNWDDESDNLSTLIVAVVCSALVLVLVLSIFTWRALLRKRLLYLNCCSSEELSDLSPGSLYLNRCSSEERSDLPPEYNGLLTEMKIPMEYTDSLIKNLDEDILKQRCSSDKVITNACNGDSCQNGATCVVDSTRTDGYRCECDTGFTGDKCENKVTTNACNGDSCQNGATCVMDSTKTDGYLCECDTGFTGDKCENKVSINACNGHSCQNGATCVVDSTRTDGYRCECDTGFTGDKCESKAKGSSEFLKLQDNLRSALGNGTTDQAKELVMRLMSEYKSNPQDWQDKETWSDIKYTRTLLDKGNGHYNLMLLCWNTGQESPIHNHPNSHCFMKTLMGTVHEEVYKKPNTSSCCQNSNCEMVKIADRDYKVDDVALITDNDGVHRVGNRSHVEKAVALHLYCPPFSTCHKYDDKSSKETEVPMGFDPDFTERCCPHTDLQNETSDQVKSRRIPMDKLKKLFYWGNTLTT